MSDHPRIDRLRAAAALLAALALLGCPACAPATSDAPAGDVPAVQSPETPTDAEETDPRPDAHDVLRLADLLASPADAYDRLAQEGLTWNELGRDYFASEAGHDAMVDTEASHPVYDALAALGAEQPAVGEDYFVGPGSVCLGAGLSPSVHDSLAQNAVLGPDDVAGGAAVDSVSLSAPLASPLSEGQLDELVAAAGLSGGEEGSFRYDDTAETGVLSEARAGIVSVGGTERVWYVRQTGYVGEGGSSALLMGIVPVDVASGVVETSVLRAAGQLGSWDEAGSTEGRLALFATAVAQDAIVGNGGSWASVVTGELMTWDPATNGWSAAGRG